MFVRPGEGEAVTRTATRTLDILCDLPALSAVNIRHAPGEPGPDLHVHREHTDAFYVLEGTLVVSLGPDATEHELGPGSLALAPANVIHTFRNGGDGWLSILNLHAPGGGFNAMLRGARDGVPVAWDSFEPPGDGGRPASDGVVSRPGEGAVATIDGRELLLKAQALNGDGTLTVTEETIAPGAREVSLHAHRHAADCVYVLDGTLGVRLGDEALEAPAGTFAAAAPGEPQLFFNAGAESVRALNLVAPGGREAEETTVWAIGSPQPL